MRLSVVIPVLNEAERLPALLDALGGLDAQIIVADGGSTDGSADVARQCGVTVLESAPGRAGQINAGAATATGDVLLFLHADTQLPAHADSLILDALSGEHVWGRFDVIIEGRPAMLRVVAALMNLRSRLSGIATGDQAIFVTRHADLVARLRGDEFGVLAIECYQQGAETLLERIAQSLDAHSVAASTGMAVRDSARGLSRAWEQADHQMYEIKKSRHRGLTA